MSVPTLTGLTLIDGAESTTNWTVSGTNSNKFANQSEVYLQGSSANRWIFNAGNGDGQALFQSAAGIDLTANLFMIWVYPVSTAQFDPFDQTPSGIYVRLSSSTSSNTADYGDYFVGGGDIAWCGRGWHLIVVDANRTPDRTSGTFTKTAVRRFGVGFANTGVTASQAPSFFVDAMYYGNTVEVTGPSFTDGTNGIDINSGGTIDRNDAGSFITDGWEVGDFVKIVGSTSNDGIYGPITTVAAGVLTISGQTFTQETANTAAKVLCSVTFEDIYQKDGPTDDNWWGVVSKDLTGAYIINYPLTLGDVSGSGDLFFLSRGETVTLADQALDTTREEMIILAEDTGETHFHVGDSTGTGDDRAGFVGTTFTREETIFNVSGSSSKATTSPYAVALDANVTAMECYAATFAGLDAPTEAVDFATGTTAHYVTNVTFSGCGQIDLGDVESRGLIFTGYDGTDAALLWNESIDIKNSQFLGNTDGTNDPAGIEHTVNTGSPYTYDGLTFAGNDNDIYWSAASGDITINAINGANPTTDRTTGTGAVTINNAVVVSVEAIESTDATQKIQGAIVFLHETPVSISSITRSGSTATVTTSAAHGYSTDDEVAILSSDATDFEYKGVYTITVTGTTTFTYTVTGAPGTPATGTFESAFVVIDRLLTNASGIAQNTGYNYSTDQDVQGFVRKSTASPTYKPQPVSGTITSAGLAVTAPMVRDGA